MIRKRKLKNYLKKLLLLIYFEKTLFTHLLLKTYWYVKQIDYTYRFKLFPEIISQYSYKYKFFRYSRKKKIEIVKFIYLIRNLLVKDLVLKSKPKSSNTIPKFFIGKKF